MNKLLTTSGLLIALALFLGVNIISNAALKSARLDLTEGQLYTLSEGTKNILTNLEEPVTLRFYFSQKLATHLPGISSYTVRVKELLEEYQRLAGDKLHLKIIDPEPFSEAEDRAVGFGLQGVPIDNNNTTFYFGLAGTNSVDDEEVISFFQPNREEFLEYDVTKLVHQLAYPEQKTVGLMSNLPLEGSTPSPFMPPNSESWMIVEQMRQLFEVRKIEMDTQEIPSDINLLMIVHPKHLSDETLYAIDQFVLRGGRAMVFVDPYSEAEQPPQDPQNPLAAMQAPRDSNLQKLFDAWGVNYESNKTVAQLETAQRVQVRKGQRLQVISYPVWMDLNQPNYFNQKDIVTGKLGNMMLATAGYLTKKADVDIEFTPLLQTGENAMSVDTSKLGFMADPEALVNDFKPEKQFVMAARIAGKFKTAFPDGAPKSETSEDEEEFDDATQQEHLIEAKEVVNLIIVADTDLLEDKFWVQVQQFLGQRIAIPLSSNADFVTNALESLTGSNDLISVRSRGSFARPFTKVEEIQQAAEQQFREKEQKLQARLEDTEKKLSELQSKKQDNGAIILTAEQQQEIERFLNEKIQLRKELRGVQHDMRKNIESLETTMKFINIGLMPLFIGLGGIMLGFYRSRRKRGRS